MEGQYFLYDGKTEAASVGRPYVVCAGFVVTFPYVINFVRSDSGTVVGNFAAHFATCSLEIDDNLFVFAAIFYCIVYKV